MQDKISRGLKDLIEADDYLLHIDINERTITHRLGMHYQALFPTWHVDCEYNKRYDRPKDVEFDIKNLLERMADLLRERQTKVVQDLMGRLTRREVESAELTKLSQQLRDPELEYDSERGLWIFILTLLNGERIRKPVVPDIIIHKRGEEDNYIAIEAKKTSNTSPVAREYDLLKLQAYIQDNRYRYRYGFFIDLPVGDSFDNDIRFVFKPDTYESRITLVGPDVEVTNGGV